MIESLAGQGIDVQLACVMLGVSASGYYAWKDRPPSMRTLRHAWLVGEIARVHKDSGATYGVRRVTAELRHGRGITVGHNQVELLMGRRGCMDYRNAGCQEARSSANLTRWILCAAVSAVTRRIACG